jgi:hypothetical protein
MVKRRATSFNIENVFVLPADSTYVFYMNLRTRNNYSSK